MEVETILETEDTDNSTLTAETQATNLEQSEKPKPVRLSPKQTLEQKGEVVIFKQLYNQMLRYELSPLEFSNILANFIAAVTEGNYPPKKKRRKMTEVEKLRLKLMSLDPEDRRQLVLGLSVDSLDTDLDSGKFTSNTTTVGSDEAHLNF